MWRNLQVASWMGMIVLSLVAAGCGSGDGGPGAGDAQGFASPDEALDTYARALEQGDEVLYRKVAVKDKTAIEGLDALITLQTDMEPAEAAKVNLEAMAKIQGFGGVMAKRFDTEIDGDKAAIVHVFEDTGGFAGGDKFRKWLFEKSGNQWFLVGSEFGAAEELPEQYAWDKNIADISDPMRDFVSFFDGTEEGVEAALAKHAEGVETDMDYYMLDAPVVTAKEEKDGQEIYTIQFQSGAMKRIYTISWQDDKIASITEIE